MHGIINVFKMPKWTSFDVVAKMRKITGIKQIGHMGTLDPMATGVLPVFIGNATKAIDLQTNTDKEYYVSFMCGIKTNTGDIYGEITQKSEFNSPLDINNLNDVIPQFLGKQEQVPPMFSAVKINGKPLYKLAREGKEIKRKPREITVYSIIPENNVQNGNVFSMTVHCSKGTYIRTLVEDIALKMGTIATTTALTRTKAGIFTTKNAYTLEQIANAKNSDKLAEITQSIHTVFENLPKFYADTKQLQALLNGVKLKLNLPNGIYGIYHENLPINIIKQNECGFVGVCEITNSEMRVKKMFVKNADIIL